MISFKHILSPITEKRNLILILFIALFFSVFRLSGGGISSDRTIPVERSEIEPAIDGAGEELSTELQAPISDDFADLDSLSPAADIAKLKGGSAIQANNSRNSGSEDLLDGMRKAQPTKRAPTNGGSNGGNSKLAEIERSLGLR